MAEDLAIDVINEIHGPIVGLVAKVLSIHGPLTLQDMVTRVVDTQNAKVATVTSIDYFNTAGAEDMKHLTPLKLSSIKSALVILMRYSIVQPRELRTSEIRGPKINQKQTSVKCLYHFSPKHAIMLLRSAKIVLYVKKHIGKKEACLVEELMVRGSDTRTNILNEMALRIALKNDDFLFTAIQAELKLHKETAGRDYTEESVSNRLTRGDSLLETPWAVATKDILNKAFKSLVKSAIFIERATHDSNSHNDDIEEVEFEAKETPKSKRRKLHLNMQTVTSQDCPSPISQPANLLSSNATNLTKSLELQVMLERAQVHKPKGSPEKNSLNKLSQRQPNNDLLSDKFEDAERMVTTSDEEVPEHGHDKWWRMNYNFFLHSFRIDMIKSYLMEKTGERELKILPEIVFSLSSRAKFRSRSNKFLLNDFKMPEISDRISTKTVFEHSKHALARSYRGQEEAVFKVYLKLLSHDSKDIVSIIQNDSNDSFLSFKWKHIIDDLKFRCIFNIIERQHGKKGARIIRLLQERGALEEKQVGDLVMIPRKEARSKLYELLKSGLILWEEAPKRADFAPSQVYHLFSVDMHKLVEKYRNLSYKAMLNMRIRYRVLSQYNKELDRFTTYEEEVASGQMTQEEMLQVPGVEKYHRYRLAFDKLDKAMLELDQTCLLLGCF